MIFLESEWIECQGKLAKVTAVLGDESVNNCITYNLHKMPESYQGPV